MSPDTQKDFLKSKGEAEGIKDFDIILNDRYIDGIYIDGAVAVGIIFFAIFIMFASSFVIYSIFYISIVNVCPVYFIRDDEKTVALLFENAGEFTGITVYPFGSIDFYFDCSYSLRGTMAFI